MSNKPRHGFVGTALEGIEDLRRAVAWANAHPEHYHEGLSPTDIVKRWKQACASDVTCPRCGGACTEANRCRGGEYNCHHCHWRGLA